MSRLHSELEKLFIPGKMLRWIGHYDEGRFLVLTPFKLEEITKCYFKCLVLYNGPSGLRIFTCFANSELNIDPLAYLAFVEKTH